MGDDKVIYSANKVKPKENLIKIQALNIIKNRATLLMRFSNMLADNHPFSIFELNREEKTVNEMTKEIKDNVKILIKIRKKELKDVK